VDCTGEQLRIDGSGVWHCRRSIQRPYNKGSEEYFKESEERFENGDYENKYKRVADSLKKHKKERKVFIMDNMLGSNFLFCSQVEHV
jgi:carboxyl-terminal processing protease